jgi:hypothetical protein
MIRETDGTSLVFSLWEQSRKELAAAENKLYELRKGGAGPDQIDVLDAEIAVLRVKTERLLGQAIDALREQASLLSAKKSNPT